MCDESITAFYEFGVTYTQDHDCNAPNDDIQEIEIKASNCGGGDFYIIKTERWAINEIDDLINLLKKAKKTFNTIERIKKNNENE